MKKMNVQLNITEYSYAELTEEECQAVDCAVCATRDSYAPYSSFHVGACVVLDNGQYVKGNNQENAAYPSCMCAERVAIYSSQAQFPGSSIRLIALAATDAEGKNVAEPVTPCGSCRQVMVEQEMRSGTQMRVLMVGAERIWVANSAKDLLPLSFCEDNMKIETHK